MMRLFFKVPRAIIALVILAGLAWGPVGQARAALAVTWIESLGFFLVVPSKDLKSDLKFSGNFLLVAGVADGGVAARAGIRKGDLVVDTDPKLFRSAGRSGTVNLMRSGKKISVSVKTRSHKFSDFKKLANGYGPGGAPRVITVDQGGKGDFRTITAALSQARPGDTVKIGTGAYEEGLLLPSRMTLGRKKDAVVFIESTFPLRIRGAQDVVIDGLRIVAAARAAAVSGKNAVTAIGISIAHSERVTVRNCSVESENGLGVILFDSEDIRITGCEFRGSEKSRGILVNKTGGSIKKSDFSGQSYGVNIDGVKEFEISDSIFDLNDFGIIATNSNAIIINNTITLSVLSGIVTNGGKVLIEKNNITESTRGITTNRGDVQIKDNWVVGNKLAMVIRGGTVAIEENTILDSLNGGINLNAAVEKVKGTKDKKIIPGTEAVIKGNMISVNGGTGVWINGFKTASVSENIIAGNKWGLFVASTEVLVSRNTFYANDSTAINIFGTKPARIDHNIVAENGFGIGADKSTPLELDFNNVFGNLVSRKFPLKDGNYLRRDHVLTTNGDRIGYSTYPAYDLKGETDISVEPGLVDPGTDFRISPESELAKLAAEGHLIGARGVAGAPVRVAATPRKRGEKPKVVIVHKKAPAAQPKTPVAQPKTPAARTETARRQAAPPPVEKPRPKFRSLTGDGQAVRQPRRSRARESGGVRYGAGRGPSASRFKSLGDILGSLTPDRRPSSRFRPLAIDLDIQFEVNSWALTGGARRQLDILGQAIGSAKLKAQSFRIGGHTDASGDAGANRRLSRRRAEAVKSYLIREFNIAAGRLKTVGYGEDRLKFRSAPNDPRNRRVEILVLDAARGAGAPVDGRSGSRRKLNF